MAQNTSTLADSYLSATGDIRYTFTNDLMFKICMQNHQILAAFLCALLGLSPEEILKLQVNDPYHPGAVVNDKSIVLDIDLSLNQEVNLNIELQITDYHDWPDRSLTYLCRKFDKLKSGDKYGNAMQCIHISILDFTLFPEYPEFYSRYRLLNIHNHHIYNDKFLLNVLDLKQIELATNEDKACGLDRWAAIFKATKWEEIKSMAENNPIFEQMAQELYRSNSDKNISDDLQRRADNEQRYRRLLKENAEKDQQIAELKQQLAEQGKQLAEQGKQLAEQDKQLAEQGKQLAEQASLIGNLMAELAALKAQIGEQQI